MVDFPGEPGKICWCWLISTFTVELYGRDTGLKLEPVVLVGRTRHRMDVECKKGCNHGIQSSLDTKFADDTLEIKYTREKCCGECTLPKVECYGQSQFMCDSGGMPLGKPVDPAVIDLWDLRNDLTSSEDKIKDLCDIIISQDYSGFHSFGVHSRSGCAGDMRCGRTRMIKGLCGEEPKWV